MNTGLSIREKEILRILTDNSGSSVAEMSDSLGVSAVTLRNDLRELANKGVIVRTRGGALPAFHPSILQRQKAHQDEKIRIAKAAADMIPNGANVMIVAGTTTSLIGKYLLGKRDLNIVTNSTLLLPFARINPSVSLTLVGGEFKASAEAMVGPNTLRDLEQFHVQMAFIGADGFSSESGITAHIVEIAEVVKKMVGQSEKTILMADSSKYDKAGFAHIMSLNRVSTMITDSGLDKKAYARLTEEGLKIITV